MIGFTLEPGASGVSIAGVDVWKPEWLFPAAAGNAVSAARAARAAAHAPATENLFISSPPRIGCIGTVILRCREQEVEQQPGVTPGAVEGAVPLAQVERARVGERAQAPFADEHLVDPADPAAVGRIDRDAERGGLAIHRPAGRDNEVCEGDQA